MMVMRVLLFVCIAVVQLMYSNAYYSMHHYRSRTNLAKQASLDRQTRTSTSATGISETEKNVVSKEKEINSGLFRKISMSNKVFEFEEILSSEDVDEYQKRFHNLMVLFPDVSETDLRTLVFISPLLLALETGSLQTAVSRLQEELPFVDPSYVISQRSCGLDLLLSCMSPMFDLETRRNDVVQVIGRERNVTEFLRRVPHCLTPRYLVALRDHCIVMKELLHLDAKSSLNIVERWPGILGIDLVQSLSRFNSSMHRLELVPYQETGSFYLTKILRAVPRALMQDMPRRAHLLRQNFPLWDLPTIIDKYPRILTQKIQGLKSNFEVLEGILDPLEISADNFVNIFPRSLGFNPHHLLATAHGIAAVLPGLSVHDIYKRVPRILSLRTKEVLVPQIRRLQKSFSKSSPVDTRERKRSGHSSAKGSGRDRDSAAASEDLELELIQIDRADYGDDDDIFMADLSGAEGSSEAKGRRKVVHLLAQINTKEEEFSDKPFKAVSSTQAVKADQQDHALKLPLTRDDQTGTPSDSTHPSALPLKSADSRGPTVPLKGPQQEGRAKKSSEVAAVDDDDSINVTRIIIGNLDTFIDRYPYFIDKVNGWTKDFGPSLAYAVLTAVPAVLTKKTTSLRPILKHLYTLIADSRPVKTHDTITVTGSKSGSEEKKDRADTVSVNSVLYSALNVLLLEAPSILKKKPADVDLRIQQLADLLEHCGDSKDCSPVSASIPAAGHSSTTPLDEISSASSSVSASASVKKAKVLALRVPRLLVESKVERIVFRSQLLLYYQTHPRCQDLEPDSQSPVVKIKSKKNLLKKAAAIAPDSVEGGTFFESVLSNCPEVLAGPSSTLARLFFAASYLGRPTVSLPLALSPKTSRRVTQLSVQHVEELLNCNTKNFLLCLSELGEVDGGALDSEYAEYLGALIKDLAPLLSLPTARQQLAPSSSLSGQLTHPVLVPSRESSTGDDTGSGVQTDISEIDSDDESAQLTASTSSSSSATSSSSGNGNGPLLSGDQGSSELERVLCGIFNDLTAAAAITGDATTSTEGQQHVPSSSSNGNNNNNAVSAGGKDVLSMKVEVRRLQGICETIGSGLIKWAK